ncbi:MAG: nucleoside deaminase [Planctomycetota bacterium]
MLRALGEADAAFREDEVPIGAVIVIDTENGLVAIASNHNRCEQRLDPTAHAEILAIQDACKAAGAGRLDRATLYSTIEPCAMCAGAILHSRIERVVFGAFDTKFGAAGSQTDLLTQSAPNSPKFNHKTAVTPGVLIDACKERMQRFFQQKRRAANAAKSESNESTIERRDAGAADRARLESG